MENNGQKPHDIDARLKADSDRLLAEMESLIGRARLLILERGRIEPSRAETLGEVLYRDGSRERAPEKQWAALVESMAAGDSLALRGLYERSQRVVLALMQRLAGDAAEELTLDFFHDLPRAAVGYDARGGSVLAWVMNQARARALEWRSGARLDGGVRREPLAPAAPGWTEPEWEDVAPGIAVKMLATDAERDIVSMLVRLVPGGEYPAHTHAGVEELHLLEGELWIDDRKLSPGDYNRAEPGSGDQRVWSETGCTCLLVTSAKDILR